MKALCGGKVKIHFMGHDWICGVGDGGLQFWRLVGSTENILWRRYLVADVFNPLMYASLVLR